MHFIDLSYSNSRRMMESIINLIWDGSEREKTAINHATIWKHSSTLTTLNVS